MSASDAAPLPRLGEVFFDVRGSSRSMRLSWYSDTGVAVFSIWQGGTCTGTFRLPIDDLPRMVEALQRGPRGAALPAGDSRELSGERPRRGVTGAPTDAMPAVASFPDYATGQHIAPVTGEFRSLGPGDPSYRDGPLGSGSYPAYRERDRGQDSPGASFPGYTDDGPPVYRDITPPPACREDPLGASSYRDDPLGAGGYREDPLGASSYRDDPLGAGGYREESLPGHRDSAPSYRDGPLGSGSYPAYRERDRGQDSPGASFPGYTDDGPPVYRDITPPPAYREESLPGHRDSAPSYRDGPLGSGYRGERPPSYRDDHYPPSYRDEPASYPGQAQGRRYADDPFQSVYPDDAREPGYPDGARTGSHPYGPPPERPEPRAPRGRS